MELGMKEEEVVGVGWWVDLEEGEVEEEEEEGGGEGRRRGRTFRRNCLARAVRIPPWTKATGGRGKKA